MAVPAWLRTARARLTLTYSGLVFGVAAVILAIVYVALSRTVVAEPLDGDAAQKFYVTDAGTVKFLDRTGQKDGEVVSAADLEVVQHAVNARTLDTLRTYSVGAVGGLFLFSLLVGWLVSGRVLRPVGAITRTAQEISSSDLSRRIGASGPHDELRELADTIDAMLDRLESEFVAQRALVDDVSHELRNPIAVIQATIDAVLSDEHATPDNRRRASAVVTRAIASVTQLVEDLLASARQRSGAFAEAEVGLAGVVRAAVDEYVALADQRDVAWDVRAPDGPVVSADEPALTRALRNLLSNAVRFSPTGGRITVAVGSRRGWAWAAVRDEGPGIAPVEQGRVFDRFYSTASRENGRAVSAAHGNGGHGIGLAIARQIVEAHDGRLAVSSTVGRGATFVIWLPDRTPLATGERDAAPVDHDPLGRA